MKKLTGVLIIILSLGFSVGVFAKDFKDLPNTHWAYKSVEWALSEGLVSGYTDGTYRPNKEITEQEFASILARHTYKGNKDELIAPSGTYWADGYYSYLQRFQLPLKGYNNKKAKETALTRGEIARIIAAKNGFNLTEDQAIYYMYENGISYGLIPNKMTFDSYGRDKAVTRDQIPAFFQRLESVGQTTFMGNPSPVKGNEIGGIVGIRQDKTVITSKMLDELALKNGMDNNKKIGDGSYSNPFREDEMKDIAKYENIYVKMNGLTVPYSLGNTGYNNDAGMKIKVVLLSDWQGQVGGFRDKKLWVDAIDKWGLLDENQMTEVKSHVDKYHGLLGMELKEKGLESRIEKVIRGKKYDVIITVPGSGEIGVTLYEKGKL